MRPSWLDAWLGAPLESLEVAQLSQALDAARQIAERLAQEQDKPRSLKGHQELVAMRGEWQEAIAELLRARAARTPPSAE